MSKDQAKTKEVPMVTSTQSFAATIRNTPNGKRMLVKSPSWYHHQLQKFKDGESVTLVIHNKKPKRSEQQNRYYWGAYLPLIAQETGEKDLDRLHELFKGKFLSEGVVEVLGEKVRMKRSTTELGKGEFSQFISDIETLTGIKSPPAESYGLTEFEKEAEQAGPIEYPQEDIDTSKTPF